MVLAEANRGYGILACVVEREEKKILASAGNSFNLQRAKAAALLQSEINDGDNDLVTLVGNYEGNVFKIKSVEADGYKIEF